MTAMSLNNNQSAEPGCTSPHSADAEKRRYFVDRPIHHCYARAQRGTEQEIKDWLLRQPEVREFTFVGFLRSLASEFDESTQTWAGCGAEKAAQFADEARQRAETWRLKKEGWAEKRAAKAAAERPAKKAPRKNTGGFKSKFEPQQILDQMPDNNPLNVSLIQSVCRNDVKMSKATFYRLWKKVVEQKRVIQTEQGWVKA